MTFNKMSDQSDLCDEHDKYTKNHQYVMDNIRWHIENKISNENRYLIMIASYTNYINSSMQCNAMQRNATQCVCGVIHSRKNINRNIIYKGSE